jgi:hypothetical protein
MILGMVSIPTLVISHIYYQDLSKFCLKNITNVTNSTYCNEKYTNRTKTDWLYSMSYNNYENYQGLMGLLKVDTDLDPTVNYHLVNFITMFLILFLNFFMINIVKMAVKEIDYTNITPSDYTLMVIGIDKNFPDDDFLKNDILKMVKYIF